MIRVAEVPVAITANVVGKGSGDGSGVGSGEGDGVVTCDGVGVGEGVGVGAGVGKMMFVMSRGSIRGCLSWLWSSIMLGVSPIPSLLSSGPL